MSLLRVLWSFSASHVGGFHEWSLELESPALRLGFSVQPLLLVSLVCTCFQTRNCKPILSRRIVLACFPFRPAPARPRELVGPTPMAPQGRCYKHNLVNSLEEFCSQLLFFFLPATLRLYLPSFLKVKCSFLFSVLT